MSIQMDEEIWPEMTSFFFKTLPLGSFVQCRFEEINSQPNFNMATLFIVVTDRKPRSSSTNSLHKEFQATLNVLHIPTPNEVSYSSIIFFSKAQHAISTHESYKWACYEWKFWLSFPFQADNFDYILSVIGWRWPFLGFPWKRGTPISCYLNQCKMSFYTSSNKNLCNICF